MQKTSNSTPNAQPFEPLEEVMPGVIWGRPEWIYSPAYWAKLATTEKIDEDLFRQPDSLIQEIVFCLLGGYGVTAEVNCAAFTHLKKIGIFEVSNSPHPEEIESHLCEPIQVGDRTMRYRFPRQRGRRISKAMHRFNRDSILPSESRELRDYLQLYEGIGPKTASWIVRNWTGACDVAILDIHVHRAGKKMGVFALDSVLPKDYKTMEIQFLSFADKISVEASKLDILIWSNMRKSRHHSI
jgi:thermostable 8-oxoguanine DNA glycosylase